MKGGAGGATSDQSAASATASLFMPYSVCVQEYTSVDPKLLKSSFLFCH